jgi:hypothetical protein
MKGIVKVPRASNRRYLSVGSLFVIPLPAPMEGHAFRAIFHVLQAAKDEKLEINRGYLMHGGLWR